MQCLEHTQRQRPLSSLWLTAGASVLARQNPLMVGGPLGGNWRSAICPLQSTKGLNSHSVGNWRRRICLNKIARLSDWASRSQMFCGSFAGAKTGKALVSGWSTDLKKSATFKTVSYKMKMQTWLLLPLHDEIFFEVNVYKRVGHTHSKANFY